MFQKHYLAKLLGLSCLVLSFNVGADTQPPLPKEYCDWLYESGLNACIDAKNDESDCTKAQNQFSGTVGRGVIAMSNHPSFTPKGFDATCVSSCQTQQKPDFNSFAIATCSFPATSMLPPTTNTSNTTTSLPPINKPANSSPIATTNVPPKALNSAIVTCGTENNYECLNEVLKPEKKRLNKAYQALSATYNDANKTLQLDNEQRAWLDKRNAECGKLVIETPSNESPKITACILKALTQRAHQLENALSTVTPTTNKKPDTTTKATEQWFESTAKPVLIVRDKPDVTGKKLGTVPIGGKIKVLETKVKQDSISGQKGHWVKVEWLEGSGYVFDVFLKPV
jgi:uncharacterized protein YecT (DUF1311 family)